MSISSEQLQKDACCGMIGSMINTRKNETANLETVKELVKLLNHRRSLDHTSWMSLGWCLRNIDHRLLTVWDEFSKNSNKYRSGACDKLWMHMITNSDLRIGTLRMWAKMDNPEGFKALASHDIKQFLYNSLLCNHQSVARLIHFIYQDNFVCTDVKNNVWYMFIDERWKNDKQGGNLRKTVGLEIVDEYTKMFNEARDRSSRITDIMERDHLEIICKKIRALIVNLGKKLFVDSVLYECKYLFIDNTFEAKLDTELDLIGFKNGVFNLLTSEFRKGKHDDYATLGNDLEWLDYEENDLIYAEINAYLEVVFPIARVRRYVMLLLVTFLSGRDPEQKFYIWTGYGSNSKSKLVELFEICMQNYCVKFPVTFFLTGKRSSSNQATPELSRSVGKRLAIMQEPDQGEMFNFGILNEISRGGRFYARPLYKDAFEFRPQFKMLMLCNQLPMVDGDYNGNWRRLRTVEFQSNFVENPTKPNEFLRDTNLSDKMKRWPAHFMALLLHVYLPIYRAEGIIEPQEVIDSTQQYLYVSDHHALYLSSRIVVVDGNVLKLQEIITNYRDWCKNEYSSKKPSSKAVFTKYMKNRYNSSMVTSTTGEIGFKGFSFAGV